MRTRKEIEEQSKEKQGGWSRGYRITNEEFLEILLDIRDLLLNLTKSKLKKKRKLNNWRENDTAKTRRIKAGDK